MKVVVIGGTGLIGSALVAALGARGHDAVAASPSTGVDAQTGDGLAAALTGAEVVVDTSNSPSFGAAEQFFRETASNILRAAAAAGASRVVLLSIVGIDRVPGNPYFRAKLAQEEVAVAAASVPVTVLRSTQFFDFALAVAAQQTVDGVVRVAPQPLRPVAATDVADVLVDLVIGPYRERVEVAGPEQIGVDDLVRRVLGALGDPRAVVTEPAADAFGTGGAAEALLPSGPDTITGRTTLEEWATRRREEAVGG